MQIILDFKNSALKNFICCHLGLSEGERRGISDILSKRPAVSLWKGRKNTP